MELTKRPPYSFSSVAPKLEAAVSDQGPIGFHPYLHTLRKRKWILVFSLAFCVAVALYMNVTQSPIYRASIEVVVESKNAKSAVTSGNPISFTSDPTLLLTQIRLVRGPQLAGRVVGLLSLRENPKEMRNAFGLHAPKGGRLDDPLSEQEKAVLARSLRGAVSARQVQSGVRLLEISATGTNPYLTKQLADIAAEAYIQVNHEAHIESFKKNFSMISQSLEEVRGKMKISDITFQKIDSEIQLLETLKVFEEKYPKVIELRRVIQEMAKEIERNMSHLRQTKFGRQDLAPLLLEPHTDLASLLAIEADLYNLKPLLEQEGKTNREMYNTIFKRLKEVELGGGNSVWFDAEIIEPAIVPKTPIRPNKGLNLLLGILAGFFLGTGLAFFLEYMDSSLRSLDDVQNYLKLFPLGMIPQIEHVASPVEKISGEEETHPQAPARLYWNISDPKVPLYVAEAYRIIRTNLAFGSIDKNLKVLQITSTVKGEGKSTTTANLGISFAQTGMRVLIVDADLRRPTLHRVMKFEGVLQGLNELIADSRSLDSLIEPTHVPNLFCLAAGRIPPNPAELLSSQRMKNLIEEAGEHFDIVLIDSPPVISVADASIIASRVDGIILVCRSGYLPRHLCLQAKKTIESVNGKVIGCVLNGVLTQHQPYHYHRYSRDAYYYGTEEKAKGTRFKREFEKLKILQEPMTAFLLASWQRLKKGSSAGAGKIKNSDERS